MHHWVDSDMLRVIGVNLNSGPQLLLAGVIG